MTDVFSAEPKTGCAVGVRLIVTNEQGEKISGGKDIWFGFERSLANQLAIDITKAVTAVIDGYRAAGGEHKRIEELSKQRAPQQGR